MAELDKASSLREEGNEYFRNKDYSHAILKYLESVAQSKSAPSYSNISMCYIKLSKFFEGEKAAHQAIECDPMFAKAWLRRGICRIERKRIEPGFLDLLRAQELVPSSDEITKIVNDTKKVHESLKSVSLDKRVNEWLTQSMKCELSRRNESVSYFRAIVYYRPSTSSTIVKYCQWFYNSFITSDASKSLKQECVSLFSWVIDVQLLLGPLPQEMLEIVLLRSKLHEQLGMIDKAVSDCHMCIERESDRVKKQSYMSCLSKLKSNTEFLTTRALQQSEERIEIPVPTQSVGQFVTHMNFLFHSDALCMKYLLAYKPEQLSLVFKNIGLDPLPLELLIPKMLDIVSKNKSHSYWTLDSLVAIAESIPNFSFIKSMLTKKTISELQSILTTISNSRGDIANSKQFKKCKELFS